MTEPTEPKPETAIEPYHLGEFAKGGKIDFLTQGNVSIPLSIELLKGIVPVKQGDRAPNVVEMVMFANTVIEQKCNCYLNECWLVLMRGKYVPIIAAQKRIAKAQSMPSYDGYEWGWIDKDGQRWPSGPENKVKENDIIGAWGRIYFKDRKVPFYHEIFRSEYKYPKSERKVTMLLKTLRDQVHKYAFANEMGNLCTENEPYEEPLPAPESDVKPRDKRRLAVPSSTVDTTRAPVQEPEAVPAAIPVQVTEAIADIAAKAAKVTEAEVKKPEVDDGLANAEADTASGDTTEEEKAAADEAPNEKGRLAELYIEVNGMYVALNGQDFIEFAAYVLCLDESEVAPSKLTEEQLRQIEAYISTNGINID